MPFLSVSQKKFDKSKDLLLFIDGTVAGTPISVPGNPEVTNETYRGGACTSKSYASCSTYSLKTVDNESLFIGTFYNAHAITVDSSKTITANNTNFPDTFCPLGWQLPYSGTGGDYYDKSKSLNYYLNEYNITDDTSGSEKIRSYPHSHIYSGAIAVSSAKLTALNSIGRINSNTIYAYVRAYNLYIGSGSANTLQNEVMSAGYSIRCVTRY